VKLSAELDNGVTAAVTFDSDFADDNLGEAIVATDYVLSLTTEDAGLFFGDIKFAAEGHWAATGSMVADGFSEADGETAIRGDVNYGGVKASLSYVLANKAGTDTVANDVDQLSLGATADLGNFSVAVAYQAESDEAAGFYSGNGDFSTAEIFGVSASTTVAGATVRLAYADNSTTNSLGVSASYPVGPVTLSAYYVVEDAAGTDNSYGVKAVYSEGPVSLTANYEDRTGSYRYNVEGAYDLGNGLVVGAGLIDREAFVGDAAYYVAGTYDLGGGASLLVSYADADDAGYAADDEVGAPEYQVGTTVEVSFKF
jgi:predicted porin